MALAGLPLLFCSCLSSCSLLLLSRTLDLIEPKHCEITCRTKQSLRKLSDFFKLQLLKKSISLYYRE